MTKFKVGDRVKRMNSYNHSNDTSFEIGDIGIIILKKSDDFNDWYNVKLEKNGEISTNNDPINLKLISPKTFAEILE
jgi:hypothetical protein